MILTETQARTKACCDGRPRTALPTCTGSECMAWRWSRAKETKSFLDAVQKHMNETGMDFSKSTNEVYKRSGSTFEQVEGFCGLAGKP